MAAHEYQNIGGVTVLNPDTMALCPQ